MNRLLRCVCAPLFFWAAIALGVLPAAHAGEAWPARPVRLVVGFAAGGPTDLLARQMGRWLSERLGQQFVVENRAGAGGNIATETVVRSPADGYSVLVIATANAINTTLYPNLPYNFMRDMTPVAGLARVSYIVAVSPSLPVQNLNELVAWAKANPGKIGFGSGGIGGSNHLAVELFKAATGTDMRHIPYKGNAAAYVDLMSGQLQLIFADRGSSIQHIQSGRLRAIGVTSVTRQEKMPALQAVSEIVPGYEASAWYGFGVPVGTAGEIVTRLNATINAGHADAAMRARYNELDATPIVMSPAEFSAFMTSETERWGRAVRMSGAKAE